MTFTEAALEVLRSAGEPLHYKKITELAIERNLLSHVGKTPEVTMSSRLAMMVKKDRGQAPIIKVKPGVFAIRESALVDGQSLSPAALAAISEIEGVEEGTSVLETTTIVEEVQAKAPALPGGDVFPEEEGDDDPILAGLEQETDATQPGGRRRRRRRRRGKGGDKPETPEVSVRPEAPQRDPGRDRPRESSRERARGDDRPRGDDRGASRDSSRDRARPDIRQDSRDSRDDRPRSDSRDSRDSRDDRSRSDSRDSRDSRDDRPRSDSRDSRDDRPRQDSRDDRPRDDKRGSEDASLDWNRQPADGDLLGKDLADAVWLVLSRGERSPHSFARVAELLVRRGRLSGSPAALAPTIGAAVRADIARTELTRARPRFRLRSGRLSLSEWLVPKGLVRAEQDLLSGADRYASELRRALIQKLGELPTAGFAELLATWLNAEGVTALRAVRRPGSSGSELHFAGTRKIGSEEVRLAIVVQRGNRDLDRDAVIDVRGALHHYGQATNAWVITLGRLTAGAREEAAAQAAACALFDGMALAIAMERLGIAIRRHVIAHHELDYDLLEGLGDTPEQRERRERELEREQERERRQYSDRGGRSSVSTRSTRDQDRGRPAAPKVDQDADLDLNDTGDDSEDELSEVATTLVPSKVRDSDWDEDTDEVRSDTSVPHDPDDSDEPELQSDEQDEDDSDEVVQSEDGDDDEAEAFSDESSDDAVQDDHDEDENADDVDELELPDPDDVHDAEDGDDDAPEGGSESEAPHGEHEGHEGHDEHEDESNADPTRKRA